MIATYQQAVHFIESLILTQPRDYQARATFAQYAISQLLERLDNPQQRLTIIHIAGSKGKGSTALLLEAILCNAGLKVGTFTSPHLQRWTERFRLNGEELAERRFVQVVEQLRPHIMALQQQSVQDAASIPSFFDTLTAIALLLFQQQNVDCVILETGLGGRLDATNIVSPVLSCITSIELEHTDKLGDNLAAIAYEKAGIIKPHIPVVVGQVPLAAATVIQAQAQQQQSPLFMVAQDFQLSQIHSDLNGTSAQLAIAGVEQTIPLQLNLLGEHVAHNAALAAVCTYQLATSELIDSTPIIHIIQTGLAQAQLPARCEILCRKPWIVIDTAHTANSAAALKQLLKQLPKQRIHWLLSLTKGKKLTGLGDVLLTPGDKLTITVADPERSQAAQPLADEFAKHYPWLDLQVIADPISAVQTAYQLRANDELLCVTGSVYMAGLGRAILLDLLDYQSN